MVSKKLLGNGWEVYLGEIRGGFMYTTRRALNAINKMEHNYLAPLLGRNTGYAKLQMFTSKKHS